MWPSFLTRHFPLFVLLATVLPTVASYVPPWPRVRTVITTDMEQDDLASLIRFLLYTNELDTQGIIYTASRYHWSGDGKGTRFFLPGREYTTPQTAWRWTGTRTIQDKVIPAYADVYQNLSRHDPLYPTPEELLSKVKIGNIDFEGEMHHDTEGSNHIKSLLLNEDSHQLYLQAWGGMNTIARALKSIEDEYSNLTSQCWARTKDAVSRRAVILASGFQDGVYNNYISLQWPQVRVVDLSPGYSSWAYNCDLGQGNVRGIPSDGLYFSGDWIKPNIEIGLYRKLYRS